MRYVFLHIPKTAGQSMHVVLQRAVGEQFVCPARENDQLEDIPISKYSDYKLFSGHLDWNRLEMVPKPRVMFTLLRYPLERMLSFYFFLRREASKLNEQRLEEKEAMRAALEWSPDDYFRSNHDAGMRSFLDSHYDNFYTYYFATKTYAGRAVAKARLANLPAKEAESILLAQAYENLQSLDIVGHVADFNRVVDTLRVCYGLKTSGEQLPHINVNGDLPKQDRLREFRLLGASDATVDLLHEFARLDYALLEKIFNKGGLYTRQESQNAA